MLPPTIKTAPTSEIVRPKSASTAVTTERRAIASSIRIDRDRVAPSTRNAPPYSCQGSSIARCAKAYNDGCREERLRDHHGAGRKEDSERAQRTRAGQYQVKCEPDDYRGQAEEGIREKD